MSAQAGSYIVPQVLVFQEFVAVAEAVQQYLNAFVFGEQYALFRYDQADEKIDAALGRYVRDAQTAYLWPNRPVGAEIDQAWSRLFFDDAWLRYASLLDPTYDIRAVEDYPNRIAFDDVNLTTYDDGVTTWNRNVLFLERDVAVGDGVRVSWDPGSGSVSLFTRVTKLIHDQIAAVIHMPTDDEDNVIATSQNDWITPSVSVAGKITALPSSGLYDGSADGDISETYTVTVATAGDFGTARLTVVSASGNDDPADEVIPIDGVMVAIGARGLAVSFATGTGLFEIGMSWEVLVSQLWAPALLESDGTYGGANNGTYIATVTKGGKWATDPEVFINSTGTLDSSGPYTVEEGLAIVLPSGVELTFAASAAATGLAKGDRYYIQVTATRDGAVRSLDLLNSLPDVVFGDGGSTPALALDVEFAIIKDMEIPRLRSSLLPNWTTTDLEVTVYSQITGTDSTWTNSAGTMLSIPVIRADQFVQYRALLLANTEVVHTISDIADVESTLGPTVEANPLALGVLKALLNSGSASVKYMATKGASTADYAYVLDKIYDREDVYGLVPLSQVKGVQDLVEAHCLAASEADRGRWRVCWFAAVVAEEVAVITEDSDGELLLGTITDDADTTSVVDYTRLRCDEADFVDSGVHSGDIVRTLYVVDATTGVATYQEFVVDVVLTNEELRLVSGPSSAINVASKFEVWHTNTRDEQAAAVAFQAGTWSSRRVRLVFPDQIANGGTTMNGMYGACALAGLRSGVNFHQGLTNVEINGFDDISRTTEDFSGRQLDIMAGNGVWIITQDTETGIVYSRHQLTTDMSTLNFREDSMVSNIDAISYYFLRFFRNARYIGRRNITPGLLSQLEADFRGQIEFLKVATDVPGLGPQLIDGTLESVEIHPVLEDRIVATVLVDLPAPFNVLEIHLVA